MSINKVKYIGSKFQTKNYGELIVLEYLSNTNVKVKFLDTGYETITELRQIMKGQVKDRLKPTTFGVGIVGNSKTWIDNKPIRAYTLWQNMLKRCYDDKYKLIQQTYFDCYASENFKYFPYFKDWCERQLGFNYLDNEGNIYHMDKDILVKGNKVYSEDLCVFVPREINNLFTKTNINRGNHPIGVTFISRSGKYVSTLNCCGSRKTLGYFNSAYEAFLCYKEAKESYIKEVAEKWKGKIDEKVYDSLLNYNVEIDD